MMEVQKLFVEYLKQYISALTGNRQEFFISICDIEEEALEDLQPAIFTEYTTILVDKQDYSEAVRVRNDSEIKKIVLLSGDGIKQIDSLKDFNEYAILCNDRQLFWACMQKAFRVDISPNVLAFLDIILNEKEIAFWDFFQYFYTAAEDGKINEIKLNQNLFRLGIWNSNEKKLLTKGQVRRMIRNSRELTVERRLTKALTENRITGRIERTISANLAKGNIQGIIEKVRYEDVREYLKGPAKEAGMDAVDEEEIAEEEIVYTCSYEYVIREHLPESAEEIEKHWMDDRESGPELNRNVYLEVPEAQAFEEQREKLIAQIQQMNLPETKIGGLMDKLSFFWEKFEEAYPEVVKLTPVCLKGFCDRALGYTQAYFELLSYALTDTEIRKGLLDTGVVSGLQAMLCKVEEECIQMPYYHPVSVMYYVALKNMYEFILDQDTCQEITGITEQIMLALVQKLGMQFPVEFMSWERRVYAIDYTTVWYQGVVKFTSIRNEVVYSALDFRIIEKQITDYLLKHPLSTQITIALVEISDLNGLMQIVEKIRRMSDGDSCNLGKVDFLILSSKEEELKKQLSQMWDLIGTNEVVRFRFGRDHYYGENGYDISGIVSAVDMTIVADCSTLYYEPRMEQLNQGRNALRNRLMNIEVKQQSEDYFRYGSSDIATLWDSLQHAETSRDGGFWYWKSKEIDAKVLAYINQAIEEDHSRTIVALSSNDGILNDIYQSRYIQAHRRRYNGKSITILNFAIGNEEHQLPVEGSASVSYSLTEFYDTSLDIPNISSMLSADIEDIRVKLYLEKGAFHSLCTAYREDTAEEDEDDAWEKKCEKLLIWQLDSFPNQNNLISNYFSDLWVNQWSEGVRSITAALMVRKFLGGGMIKTHYKQQPVGKWKHMIGLENDCMEAVKIQEMLWFVYSTPAIDNQVARQFCDRYEPKMLERIIECDQKVCILEEKQREKLLEIQRKIREG